MRLVYTASMARRDGAQLPPDLARMLQSYSPEVQSTFAAARSAVIMQAPTAVELLYDSYNAVASAYSFTGRLRDAFCHLAAYSQHVNLGFNRGAELTDPSRLLQGSGKLIRHIRVTSSADVEKPLVVALIREAATHAPGERDTTSQPLIIKSASSRKRRPGKG